MVTLGHFFPPKNPLCESQPFFLSCQVTTCHHKKKKNYQEYV